MESSTSSAASSATVPVVQSQQTSVDVLWKHMTKIVKSGGRSGNAKIRCNLCNFEFTGSYSRVKAHLMRIKGMGVKVCTKITPEIFSALQRELAEEEEKKKAIEIPLPPSSNTKSCSSAWVGVQKMEMEGSKRKVVDMNNPIQKAYNMERRSLLDGEIARAFYSGGLPFHFARNPHYRKSYTMASEFNLSSYNGFRDDMIEKVKTIIYNHEKKELFENSTFYDVVYGILIVRWTKSSSPLHCLAHSLNPRYYSHAWLIAAQDRIPPHQDIELSQERNKCIKRYFPDQEARQAVSVEFARFSGQMDTVGSADSIEDRGTMDPKMWWLIHGASALNIQKIALKLLGQPCSSSCCERNWSTYSFIHSVRRNKILPSRAEDLVYVHNNLRLLSRKSPLYLTGETRLWDVGGDHFSPLDGAEELEIASLSLDEPEMEAMIIQNDD